MNKRQLVTELAKSFGVNQSEATSLLDAFVSVIEKMLLEWQEVNIHWFGKFQIIKRSARKWVNPQTKAPIDIAAYSTPTFKAWKPFKDKIKNKFN